MISGHGRSQVSKQIPFVRFDSQVERGFDIVRVRDILGRSYLEHKPTEEHRIEFFALLYIDTGSGLHSIDRQDYSVGKGDLVLITRGQVQQFRKKKNFDGYLLLFTEDFLYRKAALSSTVLLNFIFPILPARPVVSTNARARRGFRLLLEEWGEPDAPEKSEILRTLLDYLFLQISRLRSNQISGQEQTGYQQLFARYFALMRAHHRETRNAKDYAGMLGVSYKHLNTVCRQVCTRTAKRALDEFNVLEMKRALATGDDSVEDLSVSFGFDETTNFIKYFKRHALVTPAGFRRGLRKGPVRD